MKNIVVEGQISLFDLPIIDTKVEEFKITDEEITEVLLNHYKKHIYLHFINEPYNNALFLKDAYGIGGEHGHVLKNFKWSDVDTDSNGLRITKEEGNKKAEITLNWSQVSKRIEKLIKDDKYLTKEEKVKYGLIKVKENKAVTPYNTIVDKYKKDCRFIVLGKHGLMVHMKNKAMFFTQDGKMKDEIDSTYIPPKPLGKILVNNIGYSDRIIKTEKQENSFAKGEKVKVNFEGKERAGIVHSIYNEGNTINVLFKDKNCVQPWYKDYVRKD